MPNNPSMWLPVHDDGATSFGSHYHGLWHTCEWKHWLENKAPMEGGEGIRSTETAVPLLIGGFVHDGLEQLRRTIVLDDKWDIDRAIAFMEGRAEKRRKEAGDNFDSSIAEAKSLVIAFRDWWGPGGNAAEGNTIEIVKDANGDPVLERLYEIPLPPDGKYKWTCRIDFLARWNGWLVIGEYKTADVRGVWRRQADALWDAQMTGEVYVLRKMFPDADIAGGLLDILVKNRGAGSKMDPGYRDQFNRSLAFLQRFESDVVRTLGEMDRKYAGYEGLVEGGLEPYEAASRVFTKTGMANGLCHSYGRACPFLSLCLRPGQERSSLINFRPRTRKEKEFVVQRSQE